MTREAEKEGGGRWGTEQFSETNKRTKLQKNYNNHNKSKKLCASTSSFLSFFACLLYYKKEKKITGID